MRQKLSRESTDAYPENLGSTTVLGTWNCSANATLAETLRTVNQLMSIRLTQKKKRCRTAPGGCPKISRSPWGRLNWKVVQSPSSSLPERSTLSPCAATQETCLKTNRCFKRASAGDLIITLLLSMPQDTEVNLASVSKSWTRSR